MATSTKENVLIFLALLITYFGVYLLTQSASLGTSASDARWAGFFSVTLGVFSLLTLLFGHANNGAVPVGTAGGLWGNIYLMTAGVALAASAFFNYKLVKNLNKSNIKYIVYGNIVAHVALLASYFLNFGAAETRFNALRTGLGFGGAGVAPVYTPLVAPPLIPGTPSILMNHASPRLPMRVR